MPPSPNLLTIFLISAAATATATATATLLAFVRVSCCMLPKPPATPNPTGCSTSHLKTPKSMKTLHSTVHTRIPNPALKQIPQLLQLRRTQVSVTCPNESHSHSRKPHLPIPCSQSSLSLL